MPQVLWAILAVLFTGAGTSHGCTDNTDIIYVVDANAHVNNVVNDVNDVINWRSLMKTLRAVTLNVGKKAPGARFAFIRYARVGNVAFNLKTFDRYQDAADAITSLGPSSSYNDHAVNLHDGLTLVEVIMSAGQISNAIRATTVVIVSDERPNLQSEIIVNQAKRLAFLGVRIVAVALTSLADESALTRIITSPVRDFYRIADYSEITKHEADLVNLICPPLAAQILQCSEDADIVIVLDSSGSMTETNPNGWMLLKSFADSLISNLASSRTRNYRFGLVKFSERAIVEVPIQEYSGKFAAKLLSLTHMRWLTNHADALRKADSLLSSTAADGRAQYIVIITDGVANVEQDEGPRIAKRIRDKNIGIVAAGVTEQVNREKLYELTGSSANTILAENFDAALVGDLVTIINALQVCPGANDPQPQLPPTSPACGGAPEIVFVLDASDSIDLKRLGGWEMVKQFTRSLAGRIKQQSPDARFGVVTFGPTAVIDSELNGDIATVQFILANLAYIGGITNQAAGLRLARQVLASVRVGATKYVIILTDGTPTTEVGQEYVVSKILRDEGTRMIVVGVTSHRNEENLFELAGPDGVVFQSDTYGGLTTMIAPVISATRACPPNAVPCNTAYVIFAIDQSESIEKKGAGNFERVKRFVTDLSRGLRQRYSDIQFALVSFSDQADVLRYFGDYKGPRKFEEFLSAVDSMTYHNEETNLAAALNVSMKAIVKGVSNTAQVILITDGEPNMQVGAEQAEAQKLRDLGVRVLTFGVTNEINRNTLERISGDPKYVFLSPDFHSLTPNIEPLILTSCDRGEQAQPADCEAFDVVFVLDASGSVDYSDWRNAKELLKDIIVHLNRNNPGIRFGVVVFSSSASLIAELSSDTQYVSSRLIDVLWIGQETNIAEGMMVARTQGFRNSDPNRRRVTVLISDGNSNQNPLKEIDEAQLLKDSPYMSTVVAVGVTDKVDFNVLRQVASRPELVIGSPNFETVRSQLEQIVNAVCVPDGGSPSRDIPTCVVDLALIVDASSSITEDQNDPLRENWNLIKQTLFSLINSLGTIGPAGLQVALVTFSNTATVRHRFNDSSNPELIDIAINNLKNDGFLTNMADAFQVTRMNVFGPNNGKRIGVPQAAILITDGQPTIREDYTYAQASLLKSMLDIFRVVAVSENVADETLSSIARPYRYKHLKNYYDLSRSIEEISGWICTV